LQFFQKVKSSKKKLKFTETQNLQKKSKFTKKIKIYKKKLKFTKKKLKIYKISQKPSSILKIIFEIRKQNNV